MDSVEMGERIEEAEERVEDLLGKDFSALGVVRGTGWKQGLKRVIRVHESIPYEEMRIPGSEFIVEGHSKKLNVGEIDGRDVFEIGRVHPNEDFSEADLRLAMMVMFSAMEKFLDGVLVTNGVGTLHGQVGREKGRFHSLLRTAMLDILGWAHRGRRQETMNVGDIGIVDDVKTGLVGTLSPLAAGEFKDFYHRGLHGGDNRIFNLVRSAIEEVQGRAPRVQSRFIAGPQFEGPSDKIEFRGKGDDVVGMSGIQEILACTKLQIPVSQIVLATNGPFVVHDHEDNDKAGADNAEKTGETVRVVSGRWPKRIAA